MKEDRSALSRELLPDHFGELIPRKKVGIYTAGYLANLDYKNKGIGGRVRIGRKIFYPLTEIRKFISERMSIEG